MHVSASSLQFLTARLSQIDCSEASAAADLALKAQSAVVVFERSPQAEHALYHRLWSYVSDALDHSNFSSQHTDAVEALEAELAGRTLTIRLSLGWVTRSATGPAEFPALEEFLG